MTSNLVLADNWTVNSNDVVMYDDNGSTIISSDLLDKYNNEVLVYKLPAIIYTSIMMLLGLPGNMIVFYIYFCRWRRSTSRMFILYLAALDMVNCATTFPMEIFIMRNYLKLDYPFLCKISRYSTYVMNSSSAMILLGIATDRFKRICRPYQGTFSERQSKYICIVSILCSMGMTWPALFLYGTRELDLVKVKGHSCLLQNRYDNTPYPMIFFGVMVTTTMLVFACLAILYSFVGKQIYIHRNFKLKNCTHVQKIEDDKSVTVRQSEKSTYEKVKTSSGVQNGGALKENPEFNIEQPPDVQVNGETEIVVDVAESVQVKDNNNYSDNELRPYQLGLPLPSPDIGTSCGMLDIPSHCNNNGSFSERSLMEPSTRNVSIDSKIGETQDIRAVTPPRQISPMRKKPKVKRKQRRVRYMLVRGASTLHASSRSHCSNCLTVRIGRSTLMLFLITLAYVLSFLPFYIIVLIRQTNDSFIRGLSNGGYMAYEMFLRSYILSSAINPLIYSFCNTQFREYCKDLFSRVILRRNGTFNGSKLGRR